MKVARGPFARVSVKFMESTGNHYDTEFILNARHCN